LALLVAAGQSQRVAAADKVVTDADKGGIIHLKTGESFELRLKSNPSTGYMWYVEKESTPLLKLVHQSQAEISESGEPGEPLVGRPVYQVFKFEGKHYGQGVLRLHYVRSWEPATPDDEQFDLHVKVE
jgi:inhibitor of cysteine peptidase